MKIQMMESISKVALGKINLIVISINLIHIRVREVEEKELKLIKRKNLVKKLLNRINYQTMFRNNWKETTLKLISREKNNNVYKIIQKYKIKKVLTKVKIKIKVKIKNKKAKKRRNNNK